MARRETERITRLVHRAVEILTVQQPMTVRQLFYQMVSAALIDNSIDNYRLVSRITTIARNDGRIAFGWIVDRSRPEYSPNVFDDARQYAGVVSRGYRKDYWRMQPQRVEVWCEKNSVIGSIRDLIDELGVKVRVVRGFLSTTQAYEIAQSIKANQQPTTAFYL